MLAVSIVAHATAACDQVQLEQAAETSTNVVDAWERSNFIGVPTSLRNNIATNLCISAKELSSALGDSFSDELTEGVSSIRVYLDSYIKPGERVRSFAGIIRSERQFGSEDNGADWTAGTEIKVFGQLLVNYNAHFDSVAIDGHRMNEYKIFLVPVGSRQVDGLLNGTIACQKTLKISPVIDVEFSC